MKRSDHVFAQVQKLYLDSPTHMGQWMWSNHVQWVADRAVILARKYHGDVEKSYCAALLHDLADAHYERGHDDFVAWSKAKGEEILRTAGFGPIEVDYIIEAIRTHSCRPGNLPAALEGKILATADAMWHLQTSFYSVICYMNRPEGTHTYEEWQAWFGEQSQRNYQIKIFFEDERAEVRPDYEALTHVFSKPALSSR